MKAPAQILLTALALCAIGFAQSPAPTRPKILGVAHIGLRTDNLAAARRFYTGLLGFQEPFSLDKPPSEGTGLLLTYFKVNDHQYIEVFPELTDPKQDRLSHISFETSDAEQLRAYLAAKGVKVPDQLEPMLDGNRGFDVTDPDGHDVEFVQLMPGSLHSRNFGKFLPTTRISERIIHVGVVVSDRAAADRFYKDILGFQETWHGGMKDTETDWVDMRVPDGTDWLEYMLNVHNPDPHELGVMHHLALGVPSVKAGYHTLQARCGSSSAHAGARSFRVLCGRVGSEGGPSLARVAQVRSRSAGANLGSQPAGLEGGPSLAFSAKGGDSVPSRSVGSNPRGGPSSACPKAEMPEKPQIGRDGKWQLNLYDPNFTRVELMEPKPVRKPCCSPISP